MAAGRRKSKSRRGSNLLSFALFFFAVAVLLCLNAVNGGRRTYSFVENGSVTDFVSYESDPLLAMEEAGISLGYGDRCVVSDGGSTVTVEIRRSICVTLVVDGSISYVATTGSCVRDVLAQVGITVDDDDILSCGLGDLLEDGMTIELTRVTAQYSSCHIATGCGLVYVTNPAEPDGTARLIAEGSSGVDCVVFKDVYVGGVLTRRETCGSYTVVDAADRVVEIGTGEACAPYLVLADGRVRPLPQPQGEEVPLAAAPQIVVVPEAEGQEG